MKHERLRTCLISAVLSFGIALGSVYCLVTGFSLTLAEPRKLLLLLAGLALLCSGAFLWRRGEAPLLCLLALGLGWLWYEGTLVRQLQAMITAISRLYDSGYNWGYLVFPEAGEVPLPADYPTALLGGSIVLLTSRSLCRRTTPFFALMVSAVPLLLCLVLTDIVPDDRALMLLLFGMGVLVLTSGARRESAAQGNRLTLLVLLPLAVMLAILVPLAEKADYVNNAERAREALSDRLEVPVMGEGTISLPEPLRQSVDLASLNRQNSQRIPVMRVTAPTAGILYLRGQDFDEYTGTHWRSDADRREDFSGWGESEGEVSIFTFGQHSVLYFPYYPGSGAVLEGGALVNSDHLQDYTAAILPMGSAADPGTLAQYTALPPAARSWAEERTRDLTGTNRQKAAAVGSMVSSSASYDLDTGRMPENEADFAQWFFEKSDTGYCVHFATAAAVLLRGAGVPARYVTGYKAETLPGSPVTVTATEAHAWVEYYEPEEGAWLLLEATPAAPEENRETVFPTATLPKPGEIESETGPADTLPTEEPEGNGVDSAEEQETRGEWEAPAWLSIAARLLAGILLAGLLLVLRRFSLLAIRKAQFAARDANGRALLLWRETERLAKRLGEEPPMELAELALKARFSQHALQPEELAPFTDYRRKVRRTLAKRKWYSRFRYRYIDVLY